MPKHPNATEVYNAIFQEHNDPGRAITGRNNRNSKAFDKGISCHVFATASPTTWEKAKEVNAIYSNIGTQKELERLQAKFQHEFAEEDKKALDERYQIKPFPEPSTQERRQERRENMQEILDLRNLQETVLPVENMYLCGGFREGKMTPEHMWVEDHTNKITYDTFIDRNGIAVVENVGVDGQPFKPGCEGSAFRGSEIHRVKVDGYTWGQLLAIASGAEKTGFPKSIENTPQVLAAKLAVEDAKIALSKIPEAHLSKAEREVLAKVDNEQGLKTTQKDIDNVVKNLDEGEKINYNSALAKLAEVGNQRRIAAREAVGLGPEAFLERVNRHEVEEDNDFEIIDNVQEVQHNEPKPQSTYDSLCQMAYNFSSNVSYAASTAYNYLWSLTSGPSQ